MEAARALADLVEISPQIEAAVVFDGGGESLGCVGVSDWWATAVTRAARELLDGADAFPSESGGVTQLHASLGEGDVFVVRGAGRSIVAVTPSRQAPGLVFYDLKRCLAALAGGEPPEAKPEPSSEPERRRRRPWGRRSDET
jgi:hypothetical protein